MVRDIIVRIEVSDELDDAKRGGAVAVAAITIADFLRTLHIEVPTVRVLSVMIRQDRPSPIVVYSAVPKL